MRALVCALVLITGHGLALAESSRAPAKAIEHFRRGRVFQSKNMWDEALAEYRAAQAIAPRPALLFNVAQCLRAKGDAEGALEMYEAFVAAEPNSRGADEAREYIATLRALLAPKPEPPPPVPAVPIRVAPVEPSRPVLDEPPADTPRPRSALRVAAYATGAAGVVALGAAVYFGLQARSDSDELAHGWNRATYDAGQAAERNMWIVGGAGAAAVGAGVVMFLLSSRELPATPAPMVGANAAGLIVQGRF